MRYSDKLVARIVKEEVARFLQNLDEGRPPKFSKDDWEVEEVKQKRKRGGKFGGKISIARNKTTGKWSTDDPAYQSNKESKYLRDRGVYPADTDKYDDWKKQKAQMHTPYVNKVVDAFIEMGPESDFQLDFADLSEFTGLRSDALTSALFDLEEAGVLVKIGDDVWEFVEG